MSNVEGTRRRGGKTKGEAVAEEVERMGERREGGGEGYGCDFREAVHSQLREEARA